MRRGVLIYARIALGLIILVGLGLFIWQQSKAYLVGPDITILYPLPGSTVSDFTTIIGTASNVATLSLNGREIFTDTKGNFREELLLAPGLAIITLQARDSFDRMTTRTLELAVVEDSAEAIFITPRNDTTQ